MKLAQGLRSAAGPLAWRVLALALFVIAWMLVDRYAAGGFLPDPLDVLRRAWRLTTDGDGLTHIAITMRRVLIGTAASAVVGVSLGVVMGLRPTVATVLRPLVIVGLSIPGPVYIIMAVLILGIGEWATLVALVAAVSVFATNVAHQGVESRDVRLDQMAELYGLGLGSRLKHVLLPQIAPSTLLAIRTSFSLSWKMVVIIEALSRSDGVGAMILRAFRLIDSDGAIAFVLLFMILMVAVENLVFQRLERWTTRWQAPVRSVVGAG